MRFTRGTIAERIAGAAAVIVVFSPGDSSGPIESGIANCEGKRQLVLHQAGVQLPRVMAGQPGVEMVAVEDSPKKTLERIATFLRSL